MLEYRAPISPDFIESAFKECNEYNAELYERTGHLDWSINNILKVCLLHEPTNLPTRKEVKSVPVNKPAELFDPNELKLLPVRCRYEIVDQFSHKVIKVIYVVSHARDCLDFFTVEEGELLFNRVSKQLYNHLIKDKPANAVAMAMNFTVVDNAIPEDVIKLTNLINTDIPSPADTDICFVPTPPDAPLQ